jgi:hypothetical protein
LTWGEAKAELATRLNDPGYVFWGGGSSAEAGQYLALAMREFNCLTAFWVSEYAFNFTQTSGQNWYPANGSGSPRQPTLSDISLYTLIEYMLLEPPSGGTWTGTNQFSIGALAQAVQGRRDESLQIGATNLAEISLSVTPGNSRVTLPDTVLDVLRVRYVPAAGQGTPVTLNRGDAESFRVFTPSYLQTAAPPLRWDVISGPPLALTLDAQVPVPCTLQILTMQAEAVPDPPEATPLGLPDDWSWVPLFGALADLLSSQEESRDIKRAEYAAKRYEEGLGLLKAAPWLLEARVNNVAIATPSVITADRFNYEWESNADAFPQVIAAGTDLYAISPVPTGKIAVTLVVVANAPIPTSDSQEIQVPRDVMDALLDEAEHLALFKRGGPEFAVTLELHQSFLSTAARWNSRIRESGIFSSTLRPSTTRTDVQQPRFALPGKG